MCIYTYIYIYIYIIYIYIYIYIYVYIHRGSADLAAVRGRLHARQAAGALPARLPGRARGRRLAARRVQATIIHPA